MKFSIAFLAGLFIAQGASNALQIDTSSCKVQKIDKNTTLNCNCTGGSGSYDWHFSELPSGWSYNNDKIVVPNGLYQDKKVYGAKVEVRDKKSNDSVQKSLFFTFDNGKVGTLISQDINFDLNKLLTLGSSKSSVVSTSTAARSSGITGGVGSVVSSLGGAVNGVSGVVSSLGNLLGGLVTTGKTTTTTKTVTTSSLPTTTSTVTTFSTPTTTSTTTYSYGNSDFDKLFSGVTGIGGGAGLSQLNSYFLGNGLGLYTGNSSNTYYTKLPSTAEIDRAIATGQSINVRQLIIYAVQSSVKCTEINSWLEIVLKKVRDQIASYKEDIEGAKNLVITIQEQITFLQNNLKELEASQVTIAQINAQITELRTSITTITQSRNQLTTQITFNNQNIDLWNVEISRYVQEKRLVESQDAQRNARITQIDDELSKLQIRIKALNDEKDKINAERATFEAKIKELQGKIDAVNIKVEAAKVTITELRAKFQAQGEEINFAKAKIEDLEKSLKANDNKQRTAEIKQKIAALEIQLTTVNNKLSVLEPALKDFTDNYDELAKVGDENFYGCYKTINEGSSGSGSSSGSNTGYDYNFDYNGWVQFPGQTSYIDYINLIFGTSNGNIRGGSGVTVLPGSLGGIFGSETTYITLTQTNIFSKGWISAFGSPLDNDVKFSDYDFACQSSLNSSNSLAFKGSIQSIRSNIAKVVDDKGVVSNLYLGGCTRIESANKPIPQIGDQIYWRGSTRTGGKANEYNVYHISCL